MRVGPTEIADTFAEAFTMYYTRLLVTAIDEYWLNSGLQSFCGYGTSVIACDAEIAIDRFVAGEHTPDSRCGAIVLAFAFNPPALQKAITNRVSQCLLTCPTTAVYAGMETDDEILLGNHLRFFGDGFQKSKKIGERRYWRIPVMDGEFLVEDSVGLAKGIAGGNFLIESTDQASGLTAAKRAVDAIGKISDVITPFPGGVVRSGSKVGSRYDGLIASTAEKFCPTLKGRVESSLHPDANCVYEIVIDGTNFEAIQEALAQGIRAAAGDGIVRINAGNYGGELGKHHFYLQRLLEN